MERALRAEVGAARTTTNAETPQHGVDSAAAAQAGDSARTSQWQGDRLVVPTGLGYAKMYKSTVWQPWDQLDWCFGDFLYGDPKLDEEPYKLYTSSDPHLSMRKRRMYLKLSLAHSGGGGWLVVVVVS